MYILMFTSQYFNTLVGSILDVRSIIYPNSRLGTLLQLIKIRAKKYYY